MNNKKRSQKQEKSVASEIGGKTVIASGAFWGNKADVRSEDFLIECKTTSKEYFNITNNIWEKILIEALRDRMRIPLLIVDLMDYERYVIFSPQDFENKFFEYELGNSEKTCKNQFRFSGYSDYEVPILFFLKTKNMDWKDKHILMAMKNTEFYEYYMIKE